MRKLKLQDAKSWPSALADWGKQKRKREADGLKQAEESIASKTPVSKDGKEQKTFKVARKEALADALPPISAEDFFKNFNDSVSDGDNLSEGYLAIAGCYAIVTLKSSREKDPLAYENVYVGHGNPIGFDIYNHLRGFGNVDVYADFKFKSPMMILIIPCREKDLETRFEYLVRDLQAESSYNKKRDISARSAR